MIQPRPQFQQAALKLAPPDPVQPWFSLGEAPVSYWEMSSPSMALWRHGLGQEPSPSSQGGGLILGLGAGMVAAVLLVAVAVNYQLGKAMAPNEEAEGRWAWGNAIAGTVFPPFTLGMAIYKNYFRGERAR